ncbi:tetratricopeptide repeat protein 39A, partial [Galendromus occidentalis]|uniref:Tetratricopeptide repeat protein 39A n=1 Tax=Galendromus occidentalis TaxID=34638 RepID=A0AAJ6VV85_9ACAR
ECIALLKQRSWGEHEEKVHFESGVMCGIGVYNLIISSLPQKVLNLLEFIGFHGDETTGEQLLVQQTEKFEGFMSLFSCIALLVHQSYLHYIFGNGDCNLEMVDKVVQQFIGKFPNGAIGLYFQGRAHQIHGRIERALEQFEEANKVMDDFIPFDAFFNWDHAYLYCVLGRWDDALRVLDDLHRKCSWSEATSFYLKGVCTYMKEIEGNINNNASGSLEGVHDLMSKVAPSCKRIAGRTIPLEVFCSMKARTFLERGRLTLPHYELMYLWGFFNMFSKNNDTLSKVKAEIETEVARIRASYENDAAYLPDWCLVRFLQGVILRYEKKLGAAEAAFREVIMHGPELGDEIHVSAFSSLEMGLLYIDDDNLAEAKEQIKITRQYRGFPLSIPLSFKVHSAYKQVKRLLEEDPCDQEDNC